MGRFIEGEDRRARLLLPECLEDYVGEDNPVRVIDAFVEQLDLQELGFEGPARTGRPGYHPCVLLKLYVYGYLNRVQSSRRLEGEAGRNVELMWLTGKLAPDFKTIADFRRDHGSAIAEACARFIEICRRIGLVGGGLIAVDGSRFKAVNARSRNFTPGVVRQRLDQVKAGIERYLQQLDTADRQDPETAALRTARLKDRLAALKEQMEVLKAMEAAVDAAPDRQISLTDPDARAMATSGRGTGMVGYNVQAAVDNKSHLIVAHDVINIGHDRAQLAAMGRKAKAATKAEAPILLADRGYFSGEEIAACEAEGIAAILPKPMTSGAAANGRFGKPDFIYQPESDSYRCPAGSELRRRYSNVEQGKAVTRYWSDDCRSCRMKARCTPAPERRISRWEHEDLVDAVQRRLDRMPDAMRLRRSLAEHVFGTVKGWMGQTHFLLKTLPKVRTEMNLHVLAYNTGRHKS